MNSVAILGAGPIGHNIVSSLALSEEATRLVVVDELAPDTAAGIALDVLQSCPIARADARISAATRLEPAAGADVIVVADRGSDSREWEGEAGLAMLARVLADTMVPVVFAGASQLWLLERTVFELGRPWQRVLGSGALALEGGVRAMTALEADCPVSDVRLTVVGRPPRNIQVVWESARIAAEPALDRLDAAAVKRIESRIPALWPPGPYALASAADVIVRTILTAFDRTHTCFSVAPPATVALSLPARFSAGGLRTVTAPATRRILTALGL